MRTRLLAMFVACFSVSGCATLGEIIHYSGKERSMLDSGRGVCKRLALARNCFEDISGSDFQRRYGDRISISDVTAIRKARNVALNPSSTITGPSNLAPSYLRDEPTISVYQDPDVDFGNYRTFSVVPMTMVDPDARVNQLQEKQLLFFVRNLLESKGYRQVEKGETPDFFVATEWKSEYRESYVPPQTISLPIWNPGRTVTTHGHTSGSFNFNSYGDYSSYGGWGNYSGNTTYTTYVPGYMTSETYTRSGYTVGTNYPVVSVRIFDGKSYNAAWTGTGVGSSNISDVRLSGQFVATNIVGRLPNAPESGQASQSTGRVGILVLMMTNDGNVYVPTVIQVGGPAKEAGIKEDDMILAINGTRVANKSLSEVLNLLRGDAGSGATLEIWRGGQTRTYELTRVHRDEIR
jgi:hypothetical protein